jgi:hypothetical protein
MCEHLTMLTIQLNIRHLCESCVPELNAYINTVRPQPRNGPMPRVDVKGWVETILVMRSLKVFNLDFVISLDKAKLLLGKERSLSLLSGEKGRELAEDIEVRLFQELQEAKPGNGVAVRVRYGGRDKRTYEGVPC